MDQTPKQQVISAINQAQQILVVPARPDGDSIGSALGLMLILRKAGKAAQVATLDPIATTYQFLPQFHAIQTELAVARDFIITITGLSSEPDKLSYNLAGDKLNIVITPRSDHYHPEQVTFSEGNPKFDLIITLDGPSYDMLGRIYVENSTLFAEVPVVNIDHHATNQNYGKLNLVDPAATSTGEILVSVAEALGVEIDADIATCLLTGIISDTGSFQHSNTTPKSLTVAAQMVGHGARQQEIIKHLFKTKSLTSLQLWGRILSSIKFDPALKLVWATVANATFVELGATSEDVGGLIDELMTSVPGADTVVLLSEREPGTISGSIRTSQNADAAHLAGLFGGGGHIRAAGFKLVGTTLDQAAANLVLAVRGQNPATPQPVEAASVGQ